MVTEEGFYAKLKVTPNEFFERPCLIWTGSLNKWGHGRVWFEEEFIAAHRLAWWLFFGNDPVDQVNHLCDIPSCCEPTHLYDGTQEQNMQDKLRRIQSTPYFSCGHPRIEDNFKISITKNGKQNIGCRECQKLRTRIWREKRRIEK